MKEINQEKLERVARIYKSNKGAYTAMEISAAWFSKLCREYGIETPHARNLRLKKECCKMEEG